MSSAFSPSNPVSFGAGLILTGTTLAARLVNVWLSESTSVFSTTTTIPLDNTIPQSGEGAEILTKTLTPSSTSNYLKFTISCYLDGSQALYGTAAIFMDAVADAKAAIPQILGTTASYMETFSWTFLLPVTSTASQTWKLRIGPNRHYLR